MHTNRATAKFYNNDTLGYLIEHTHSQGMNKGQNYPTGTKVSWVLNLQLSFRDLKIWVIWYHYKQTIETCDILLQHK